MSHTMRSEKPNTRAEKEVVVIDLDVTIKAATKSVAGRSRKGTVQTVLEIVPGKHFTKHLSGGPSGWKGTLPDPAFCNTETLATISTAFLDILVEKLMRRARKGGEQIVFLCRYQLS